MLTLWPLYRVFAFNDLMTTAKCMTGLMSELLGYDVCWVQFASTLFAWRRVVWSGNHCAITWTWKVFNITAKGKERKRFEPNRSQHYLLKLIDIYCGPATGIKNDVFDLFLTPPSPSEREKIIFSVSIMDGKGIDGERKKRINWP